MDESKMAPPLSLVIGQLCGDVTGGGPDVPFICLEEGNHPRDQEDLVSSINPEYRFVLSMNRIKQ